MCGANREGGLRRTKKQASTWILKNHDNNKLSDKNVLHLTSYEQLMQEDMEDKILVPQNVGIGDKYGRELRNLASRFVCRPHGAGRTEEAADS